MFNFLQTTWRLIQRGRTPRGPHHPHVHFARSHVRFQLCPMFCQRFEVRHCIVFRGLVTGLEEGEYWEKLSLRHCIVYGYTGAQRYEDRMMTNLTSRCWWSWEADSTSCVSELLRINSPTTLLTCPSCSSIACRASVRVRGRETDADSDVIRRDVSSRCWATL